MNCIVTGVLDVYRCDGCGTVLRSDGVIIPGTKWMNGHNNNERPNYISLNKQLINGYDTISKNNGITKTKYAMPSLTYIKHISATEFMDVSNNDNLLSYIDNIVFKESPVCDEYVYKKLTDALFVERNTTTKNRFNSLIDGKYSMFTESYAGKRIIWSNMQSPTSYSRFRIPSNKANDIEYISKEEIINAMRFSRSSKKESPQTVVSRALLLLGYSVVDKNLFEKMTYDYVRIQ